MARFLAYSVRQGGTDHSALEILDVERNIVLPDRLPEGFCTGFAFAPDGTGFLLLPSRSARSAAQLSSAVFWHRFGTERSQDQEVFFAGEEPNLFLGILDSPEAKLLAYVVFSAGKHPSDFDLLAQTIEPGASVPGFCLHRHSKAALCRSSCVVNCWLTQTLRAPNFRIVAYRS